MGLWEQLVNGKVRKCVSFKIVKAGAIPGLFTQQLEKNAKEYLLGSFIYNKDYLAVSTFERKTLIKRMPFLGNTKDGHYIYEDTGSTITRFDVSPQGETASMILYADEYKPENISFIIEFKLEKN